MTKENITITKLNMDTVLSSSFFKTLISFFLYTLYYTLHNLVSLSHQQVGQKAFGKLRETRKHAHQWNLQFEQKSKLKSLTWIKT